MKVHIEERINAYFEGRVTSSDRDALFGHLDRCTTCRDHFDALAEADRLLFDDGAVPTAHLDHIRAGVVDDEPTGRLGARWWMDWMIPAAISATVLFAVFPTDVWRAKGAITPSTPVVEVLCFDDDAKIVAHLEKSGRCPVPGFIKVVYASAETVEHLTVAVRADSTIRFVSTLASPKPRSVIPEHTKIQSGEVIEILLFTDDEPPDRETILEAPAFITVEGVDP